ncbi:translation initiation factor IF-2 [Alkalithermobacter thermoalcaliphilus JW-YL-7 = DSM 7308]|uniref:Translation initiation factor IF-2 n=1 Tax=Alkalithermobacter thermoalcaliphilus JW-YL-7 = DSM 7308 TaxID=1121328 RepID=A0A150FQD2_CLOPD|nr:initiation factor 2 [[Clostridium] paradoxum JW-YL-7 = DSM 7308]SHK59529.1 translation initiation factor IF-2 [[Clostridium] paradoxum JW-YL-7 = DSM 7308]
MTKMRVYKLAQEFGITSKELIEKLQQLGINVINHMSTLEEDDVKVVMELFKESNNNEKINEKEEEAMQKIKIADKVVVQDLAKLLQKTPSELITKLIQLGIMATINQEIDFDIAEIVALEFGYEVEKEDTKEEQEDILIPEDKPEDLLPRPPIVTVMGHVDHGKTSLLDAIRKTNVTAKEAGGITQHIGASEVHINGKKIVFLDTPGHEAFTSMRARGAQVTDISIIVVAADDGIMPQTIEAINHSRSANVPIIVAINKIDKPNINIDRVKQELADQGLLVEEWGGDVIAVPVSALKGENIDTLLEMVLLVAEIEELKANPNRKAVGTVIEAQLDKGRGPVATVLVQNGTLKIGDSVVVGACYGKVRAMINYMGKRLKEAGPSTPVEILGLSEVPQSGDQLIVVENDKIARSIAENRKEKLREEQMKASTKVSLDDLFKQMEKGEIKDLNIVVKGDVQGSVQAVKQSLEKLSNNEVAVKVIHAGVGAITESDVMLASASNAIIIGFNVRPVTSAQSLAQKENVDIRTYRIIYKAIEDVQAAMKGMLDPEYEEQELGKAEVRAVFRISGAGTVAGCYVTNGKITRSAKVRLVRDGVVIHEGELSSLKRFKDDVKEVTQGYECGISIENFNDIKEGDIIEAYILKEIDRK